MNALFTLGKQALLADQIDLSVDTIKVALVKSSYTPNTSTHQYYSDLTPASNVAGTPQTLGSKTFTSGAFASAGVTFSAVASATINYLVIYKDTGTTTTSPLLAVYDTASGGNLPLTTNGGDVSISSTTWFTLS